MNYKYRTWINLQELLKLLFVSELCEAKLVMSKLSHLKQFRIQINGRLVLSPNTHHLHPPPWQWNWKQIFVAQNSIYLSFIVSCVGHLVKLKTLILIGVTHLTNTVITIDEHRPVDLDTGLGALPPLLTVSSKVCPLIQSSSFAIYSTGYIYNMRKMRINRLCV